MPSSQKLNSAHDDEVLLVREYEDVTSCPVCSGKNRSLYIKHRNYQLLRCKKCTLVYQTPRKKENFLNEQYIDNVSSRSEYYDCTFEIDKETFKERLGKVVKMLELSPKDLKILDIGCNVGSFLDAARELGFEAMGIEPNPYAAKLCEERGFKVFNVFFDKAFIPELKEQFEVIHLGDITEHVIAPLELMKIVKDFTKPGGYVLISTPNIKSLIARLFQIKPNEHILYFDNFSLNYLAEHAGFTTVKLFITSRKRDFKSFKYSTSFNNKRNRFILNFIRILHVGDLIMKVLKYSARDELFLIAQKNES